MKVEVISRETIQPSSPTPKDLKIYKISLLDHLYPPTYIPVFIYYQPIVNPTNEIPKEKIHKLKQSLSETLTRFYAIAGRFDNENCRIECNDKGVIFCTSLVKNCTITELMKKEGKMSTRVELFPMQPWVLPNDANDYALVGFQFNVFECGGIGLGVIFSHKIVDAITIGSFLKCWANISQNGEDTILPNYSAPLLYPLRDSLSIDLFRPFFVKELMLKKGDKCVSRKFLFTDKAISALKMRATSQHVPNPSRFEAVSCFIWKHAMFAFRIASNGKNLPSVLTGHVDLRRKMTPTLPKHTIGNVLWNACALCNEVKNENADLDVLVGLLRDELNRIKDEFVPNSQGIDGYDVICKNLKRLKSISSILNLNAYICTSWVGVGFYEVDFGWGKVANVGFAGAIADFKLKNKIYLIEAGNNDNAIEAYVNLDLHEMNILEKDLEFLTFASTE